MRATRGRAFPPCPQYIKRQPAQQSQGRRQPQFQGIGRYFRLWYDPAIIAPLEGFLFFYRSSANTGQDRAMAPNPKKPHPAGELLLPGRLGGEDRGVRRSLQSPTIPREHQQSHPRRCLLRTWASHFKTTRKDQTENDGNLALAISQIRSLILSTR